MLIFINTAVYIIKFNFMLLINHFQQNVEYQREKMCLEEYIEFCSVLFLRIIRRVKSLIKLV